MTDAAVGLRADSVVSLWMITYDGDQQRTYVFSHFDRVLAAVSGGLAEYADEATAAAVVELVRTNRLHTGITVTVGGLAVSVMRLDLDRFTEVHSLLADVAEHLPAGPAGEDLRRRLDRLFCAAPALPA